MKRHLTCIGLMMLLLANLPGPMAHAGIPQPDVVLYGSAFVGGNLIENADNITLIARVNGVAEPISLFRFQGEAGDCDLDDVPDNCELDCGADDGPCDVPGCGGGVDGNNDNIPDSCQSGQYVLRLRIESLADGSQQSDNAAIVGQTANIFTKQEPGGPEELVGTYDITAIGTLQQLNLGGTGKVAIIAAATCLVHDDGGPNEIEICIDMEAHNRVEPRIGGIAKLTFQADADMDIASVTCANVQINCASQAMTCANASLAPDQRTITVDLSGDAGLANCCTFGFAGMQSTIGGMISSAYQVTSLQGDMDFNGGVTGGDSSIIKPDFGQIIDGEFERPWLDFDRNGGITGGDFSQIKPLFGNQAPACP